MRDVEPMLKSADVIRELSISNDTLYRMIDDGRLTPLRLKREYSFDPAQIAFLKRGGVLPAVGHQVTPRKRTHVLMKGVARRFSSERSRN